MGRSDGHAHDSASPATKASKTKMAGGGGGDQHPALLSIGCARQQTVGKKSQPHRKTTKGLNSDRLIASSEPMGTGGGAYSKMGGELCAWEQRGEPELTWSALIT